MDKEQFLRNIQEEDNNSLRTGAANRILQFGLSTLFQTNFFRLFFRYCTGV